jgi:hypothetical protein
MSVKIIFSPKGTLQIEIIGVDDVQGDISI